MLSFTTQYAMPPKFGRKWGTECLNTRFPLLTLLCARYNIVIQYYAILLIEQLSEGGSGNHSIRMDGLFKEG